MKAQITAPAVLAYTQKRVKEMKWPDFKYTGVCDGKAGFLNSSPNPERIKKSRPDFGRESLSSKIRTVSSHWSGAKILEQFSVEFVFIK